MRLLVPIKNKVFKSVDEVQEGMMVEVGCCGGWMKHWIGRIGKVKKVGKASRPNVILIEWDVGGEYIPPEWYLGFLMPHWQ